jgi:hypothetical protein
MSVRSSKEIESLARLNELISAYDSILEFLLAENLISREEVKAIKSSSETPKVLHTKLAHLSKTLKLQLLEYEWVVLPLERVKITIVTDRDSKEFSYGY